MSLVLKALEYAVSAAFITLGVLTVRDWWSGRDRRRGYLALALGLLGLASLIGRLQEFAGYQSEVLTVLSLVAFLGSAYALLMFRHSFIPLSRAARLIAGLVLVAAGLLDLLVAPPTNPAVTPTRTQTLVTLVLILAWVACGGKFRWRPQDIRDGLLVVALHSLEEALTSFRGRRERWLSGLLSHNRVSATGCPHRNQRAGNHVNRFLSHDFHHLV